MDNFFSVTQINRYLKNIIDGDPFLGDIWIKAEISNFKAHYSGHLYLTLKDEESTLRGVMFKSDAAKLKIRPEDGMKVLVRCRISVYEAAGNYQAYIREMNSDGIGDLYVAYEQLKSRLEQEGLFSPEFKKPIPKYPATIGVVTSATGAAVQDICNILGRRYPIGEIIIRPALVQGEDAPADIISAIRYFNEKCPVDLLIVGRGGGSIEDLWAFNDEGVARAVFASEIPVISAVGHETDFTICDFVADMRAPTPSAAAELAATPVWEIKGNINYFENKLHTRTKGIIEKNRLKVQSLGVERTFGRLKNGINDRRRKCDDIFDKMTSLLRNVTENKRAKLKIAAARLDGSSPLKIMEKGYAAIIKEGKPVRKTADISTDDKIGLILSDGMVSAKVLEVKENGGKEKTVV
ncbi:MAG: exodeoxyribonuclease VII large subunit [Bacillota bacterium]|nr:exodeoxyribonuclease VII large subunit [Bacillota bacterium]